MAQLTTIAPTPVAVEPEQIIRPRIPFAFAFAVPEFGSHAEQICQGEVTVIEITDAEQICQGEVTVIEITDGSPHAYDSSDWFASRVPPVPPMTGPVHVVGVRQGDIVHVEVLAVAPDDPELAAPVLVSLATTIGGTGHGRNAMRAAAFAGELVRLSALHPGGLLTIGPVVARQERGGDRTWAVIAALVTIRCLVAHPSRD
jgi:hypothetical protein